MPGQPRGGAGAFQLVPIPVYGSRTTGRASSVNALVHVLIESLGAVVHSYSRTTLSSFTTRSFATRPISGFMSGSGMR